MWIRSFLAHFLGFSDCRRAADRPFSQAAITRQKRVPPPFRVTVSRRQSFLISASVDTESIKRRQSIRCKPPLFHSFKDYSTSPLSLLSIYKPETAPLPRFVPLLRLYIKTPLPFVSVIFFISPWLLPAFIPFPSLVFMKCFQVGVVVVIFHWSLYSIHIHP